MSEEKKEVKRGILSLSIKDKDALYSAYMPFVRNGGLFIPTSRPYHYGEEVFILVSLMEEEEKIPVAAHIVWITPKGPGNYRSAGIGVQFSPEDKGILRSKIETYLAGTDEKAQATNTM
ncbi:MAG: PilZ domain-containing protein [Gammaproteobacteria bacterium]|nr:PilZ domain-containing protein [Gammaproteobacteria bacterium]